MSAAPIKLLAVLQHPCRLFSTGSHPATSWRICCSPACCVCLFPVLLLLCCYPVGTDAGSAASCSATDLWHPHSHMPLTMHLAGKMRLCTICAACLQMYLQVREFVSNVQYNSRAQVLSLKTPGKRKQERLPGKAEGCLTEPGPLLGVKGSLLACVTAHEGCSLPH